MDLQPRERLFRQLDVLRRKHTLPWIAAPAGSGKTSLLVSYAERREIPTIWYRVDELDRDPADLFHYMRLAVQAFERSPRVGAELPSYSPRADATEFARRFFEELFLRLPPKAMLVLDDYHLAPAPSSWQLVIQRAIECTPPGVNVVVLSRRRPPAALARAHVHEELGVLEAAELHLTETETAAFAKRRLGGAKARLKGADVRRVHEQTGGWAAGVSLLLRHEVVGKVRLTSADVDVQPMFDYLAGAVFSELTPDAQRVLLYTACLPNFTASQAAALSGVTRAGDELKTLYRAGLFISSDGTTDEVFRLHHLFRAFLAYRATQTIDPAELRAVRERAAGLLCADGRDEEAFELFVELEDVGGMRRVVLACAPRLLVEGRATLVERWLATMPADLVAGDGWLSYWHATSIITTNPVASRAGFERALEIFIQQQDGVGAYLAWAGAVHAFTYELRSFRVIESWLERLAEIERFSPGFPSAEVGAHVASSLLLGLTLAGADPSTLERWAGRTLAMADSAQDPTARVMTISVLILNYALQGDSGPAAVLVAKLGQDGARSPAGLLSRVAAHGATAALAWHQARFDDGIEAAQAGLSLMAGRPVPMWSGALLVWGSYCALERGDLSEAKRFREVLAGLAESSTPIEVAAYNTVRAIEALMSGDLAAALSAKQIALDACRVAGFAYGEADNQLTISYLAAELGDQQLARDALAGAKRVEGEQRNPQMTFWRLVVEADRALQLGDRSQAIELLRQAFRIGQERQIYATCCPTKERIAELCRLALVEGIETDYTRSLIRRRRLAAGSAPVPGWPWPLCVRTLGSLEIVPDDAVAITLGRAKMPPRLLLAIAGLASGGRSVTVEKIVSALWPDADGDMGMHSFDVTLTRLRKLLGSRGREAVRLERGRLSLDGSICWTDVDALGLVLSEVEAGMRDLGKPALAKASSLSERLLALYRGPYGGDAEDLAPELVRLQKQVRLKVAAAAVSLGRQLAKGDELAAEESLYMRALGVDGRLPLLASLVRCLVEQGNQRKARELVATWRLREDAADRADLRDAARLIGA
jgi:ATP/maltotriose-dependent transcriptional regulator MalT